MRIKEHPILEFKRGKKIKFYFEGKELDGYEGETIAAALYANGIKVFRESYTGRPRGFFCAIGKCSSCFMIVDSKPNIRTCIVPLKKGMKIGMQKGKGKIKAK
jgi:predicted molibdopterin-dependent oxidoreductase YjgC